MLKQAWRTLSLGRIATLQRGYDLPTRLRKHGDVPIVTSSGIGGQHSESRVAGPGVVTGRYGTIGQVFYVEEDFWPLNTTLFVSDFHGNHPRFVAYLLKTIDFKTHSGKSGVPGVNRNDIHELATCYPPDTKEQESIAEALSVADALVESLEQLIAKKRRIKQGAMQLLLTGKRRLPGFEIKPGMQSTGVGEIPRDWECVRLTSVARLESGHTPSRRRPEYWDGDIPWISLHDTANLDAREISVTDQTIGPLGLANSSARLLPKGTVVFSRTATIGKVSVMGREMATSQDFANYVCSERLHNHFLAYVFRAMDRQWKQLMAGSTLNTIYMPVFEQLKVQLPSISEQEAISSVLSTMDAELDVLNAKLTKARHLKSAMAHNLLTGKIRLV